MSEIKDIIKVALGKAGNIYIKELQRELASQEHIAFGRLRDSFKGEVNEVMGSLSLNIVSDSSYLWIVNNGALNGVQVEASTILEWANKKGITGSMSQGEALRFARNTARQLNQKYLTSGGEKIAVNRYFFVEIAMEEADRIGVIDDIEKEIGRSINALMAWDSDDKIIQLEVS